MAHAAEGDGFRIRGREVTRLEGFSDAVFGFALTLMVVSLEVPHSFAGLVQTLKALPAFGVCFAVLVTIWHRHYVYFRRYDLEDRTIITLNSILLFVVVAYIYPLKFLFSFAINTGLFRQTPDRGVLQLEDVPLLMCVYGVGVIAVFAVFACMHFHALRERVKLKLSPLEIALTRREIGANMIQVGVAVLSMLAAITLPLRMSGIAGLVYLLLFPTMTFWGWRTRKAAEALSR